jgi:hypothetical protein
VVVVVVGLLPFAADLVEQLVRAELDHVTVVRVPAGTAVPPPDADAAVLVVTAEPAAPTATGTAGPLPVTVVSLEPSSGRAASHPLAGEPIPLGELTPGVLRWLAEGSPGGGPGRRSAP